MRIDLQKYWDDKELYHVPELISSIIQSMQVDGTVYLITKEGKNPENNGLYSILDELCEFWKWNKLDITIDTTNELTTHAEYTIVYSNFSHPLVYMQLHHPQLSWNKEKYYGMFINRATADRIWAVHTHLNFKYSSEGLTSLRQDLFDYMSYPELVTYFFQSNQTYAEMLSIKPYSDISTLVSTPISGTSILPEHNSNDWSKVYEKIAIEVICETSTSPNIFDFSEKTWRAIYYKRPFLMISSPNFFKYFTARGYRSFNPVINETYDTLSGFSRIDRVFSILEHLIESGEINNIITNCTEILEHNYNLMLLHHNEHTQIERIRNGN